MIKLQRMTELESRLDEIEGEVFKTGVNRAEYEKLKAERREIISELKSLGVSVMDDFELYTPVFLN